MPPQSIKKYLRLLCRLHRAGVSAEEAQANPAALRLCRLPSAGVREVGYEKN